MVSPTQQGVLTPTGCQLLARVSFLVFTPSLTFTKLAQAVSLDSVRHLWPLLANMTVGIMAGLALGLVANRLLRTPREFSAHTLVSIAFGNVGQVSVCTRALHAGNVGSRLPPSLDVTSALNAVYLLIPCPAPQLPLVFTSSLCHDRGAIFYQTLGVQGGSPCSLVSSSCGGRACHPSQNTLAPPLSTLQATAASAWGSRTQLSILRSQLCGSLRWPSTCSAAALLRLQRLATRSSRALPPAA